MKKVSLFLIATLFLSVFLNSCNFLKDGYIEVWSRYDEFDGVGFDFDKYLKDLKNDNSVKIENWKGTEDVKKYQITYSDQSVLRFYVYQDVEAARREHETNSVLIALHHITPFPVSIRVDNVIITPSRDLLSNKRMVDFAKNIGIESNQIMLSKVNDSFRIARRDTDKSFESILENMEENGFCVIDEMSFNEGNYQVCMFVSSDKSSAYELVVIQGEQSKRNLFSVIESCIMDYPYHDHVHVYYSISDDFCMYFAGTSADTRDVWDEIRK